jgi:hypothetical protein
MLLTVLILVTHVFESVVILHTIWSENGVTPEQMMVVDYSSGKKKSYMDSFRWREQWILGVYILTAIVVSSYSTGWMINLHL